jgi:hypothetical protein
MSYHGGKAPISAKNAALAANGVGIHRPRLLDEVRNRLRLKHYSLRTEKAYLYWIRRYICANGRRHLRELDGVAVERFLSRLATEDHVAPSTHERRDTHHSPVFSRSIATRCRALPIARPPPADTVRPCV